MLTENDFHFPVEKIGNERTPVWVFKGTYYLEFETFVRTVVKAGEHFRCPGADEPVGPHLALLEIGQIKLLAAMLQVQGFENRWLKYPKDFPQPSKKAARGFSTNYNYLYQFGLAEKIPSNHTTRGVKWRGSPLGRAFIFDNAPCPEYVLNKGEQVVRKSDTLVYLSDFFDEEAIEDLRYRKFWTPDNEPNQG